MFWKGPVFTKDGFAGKGIDLETCSIADTLDGSEDGIIVPLFRNCHTHLGDTLARDEIPEGLTLAELVGPSGWKHKWLADNDAGGFNSCWNARDHCLGHRFSNGF